MTPLQAHLGILCLILPFSVDGQVAPDSTDPTLKLPDFYVSSAQDHGYSATNSIGATKTNTPILDLAQSVDVLNSEVIADLQAHNLNDLLRYAPGVGALDGNFEQYNLRGFRTPTPLTDGFVDNATTPRAFDSIDRVEVLLGPVSMLYGNVLSAGGAINRITKRPQLTPSTDLKFYWTGFGSYSEGFDSTGPIGKSDTMAYRLIGSYADGGSYINYFNDREKYLNPMFAWKIGSNTSVLIDFSAAKSDRTAIVNDVVAPGATSPLRIPAKTFLGEPNYSFFDSTVYRGYAEVLHDFTPDIHYRFAVGSSSLDRPYDFVFASALTANLHTLARGFQFGVLDQNSKYADSEFVVNHDSGWLRQKILIGTDYAFSPQNTFISSQPIAALDVYSPVYGAVPTGAITRTFAQHQYTVATGVYLQDQVGVCNDRLAFVVGGRFDSFHTSNINYLTNVPLTLRQDNTIPRVGALFKVTPEISVYATYTQIFVPNLTPTSTGSIFPPEDGSDYEAGVKTQLFGGKFNSTFDVYDMVHDNVVGVDAVTHLVTLAGGQRSKGVEWYGTAEIGHHWDILYSYVYTDARLYFSRTTVPAGVALPDVPLNSGNLLLRYKVSNGWLKGFTVGGGMNYSGKKYGDAGNTFTIPSYTIWDGMLAYQFRRLRVGVNAENAFDRYYFRGSSARTNISIGAPRTIKGSADFKF